MMAGIKSYDTKPERIVRRYLHRLGLRFRLRPSTLPGRPDVVLPRHRAVVFVHGCLWHQHPRCRLAYMPASNRGFWRAKLGRNVERDKENRRALRRLGWRVFVVWECATRKKDLSLERLRDKILEGSPWPMRRR